MRGKRKVSDTVSENRTYFVKALNEAISMKMRDEMEGCTEDARTSLRHKIIMKQIAKGKCSEPADKVFAIKRAILVAIIAAVFALTSCTVAIVYRKKIAGFIEQTFDNFAWISADKEGNNEGAKDYPTTIEKVYEFTYIPEGYELKSQTVQSFIVLSIYEYTDGKEIIIKQRVMNESEFKADIKQGYSKVYIADTIEVYTREDDRLNTYIFEYGGYMMQIQFKDKLSEEELTKIITQIR